MSNLSLRDDLYRRRVLVRNILLMMEHASRKSSPGSGSILMLCCDVSSGIHAAQPFPEDAVFSFRLAVVARKPINAVK